MASILGMFEFNASQFGGIPKIFGNLALAR